MEEKYLQKLEYPKIIERLADETSFSLSRQLAVALVPHTKLSKARTALEETNEATQLLRLYPTFSIGGARNIHEHLRRVELLGVLNIAELVEIFDTCRAARQVKSFFEGIRDDLPHLRGVAANIAYFKTIETALEKALTPENTLADTASEGLYRIRGRINIQTNRVKERLDTFLRSPHTSKYLQEPIVTVRSDRYVVPIKQEYRNQVPGIVHDTSSSGATLFVEPLSVMEANNELLKLRQQEEEEIAAILRALTGLVAGFTSELKVTLDNIAYLDFILAKARLAGTMSAEKPVLNDRGNIDIRSAKHPLIEGNVVPVDIVLPAKIKSMVITGPNTGGKTVTLKTLGLLTLMAQSGLFIPAAYESSVAFFEKVFADIGDEQSIEQSLSTFSAHMKNIVYILEHSDNNSLVLMDELGSGTDPTEGAALAMSILEYLYSFSVKTVATTHYSELKSFAYNREGFTNASVEFDVETLSPTYRLLMGIPGKSNAFEIASKLGLSKFVIDRASTFMNADELQAAELISRLELDKKAAQTAKHEAEIIQAQLVEEQRKMRNAQIELENKEAEVLRKAHLEAARLVAESREKSEELYQELKEHLKEAGEKGREVQKAREKMRKMEADLRKNLPEERFAGEDVGEVRLGDSVYLPKYRQRGTVMSLPDNSKNLQVQVGIMKVTVNMSELRRDTEGEKKEASVRAGRIRSEKASGIRPEIDVRGLNAEEAMEQIDKYLDDAFIANLKQVRIIHGKGTGALRAALQPYFKKHRLISETRMGDYHEGGIGCTVVTLNL